jgi:membrane-bound lytic murein transglycosylase D
VRPGDVLGTIARRVGLRIEDIRRWNQIEGDLIRVGQTLSLRGGIPPETSQPASPASSTDATSWTWHTVEAGESYWSIARDHPGVDLVDLLDLNDVAPEDLRPGMRIRIPTR